MDNLNVLVEAKKEYLGQMCIIMCPPMIEVFQEMYAESVKTSLKVNKFSSCFRSC